MSTGMSSKQHVKVCHLTSAHSAFDDRIFFKECSTLAMKDYKVVIIGQHYIDETVNGVDIVALPRSKRRLSRFFGLTSRSFWAAVKQRADVYHFHDPDLLPVGILLKMLTFKKVIYDVHEDYSQKILSKKWISKGLRKTISHSFRILETFCSFFFDFIIAADTNIKLKFNKSKSQVIANYPPLNFLENVSPAHKNGSMKIIYAGTVAEERGSSIMIEAMKDLTHMDIELHILGDIQDKDLKSEVESLNNVVYHGVVSWKTVSEYLVNADIGLLLLQPVPSYVNLTGEGVIKLYEYMMCGLVVIASDFPGLKKLVTSIGAGMCVDPTDISEVTEAIKYLYQNPDIRKEMGDRGRKAVYEKYNWENEGRKLINIYSKVLSS